MATKVSQWNSNIHILWERQITIVIYINDLFYSCSITKFQFDIIDKCLSISRSIFNTFWPYLYFTTLFLFSFSEIHILQEFALALVIREWHEIRIFNGINTILNTRNIYILVSFFCSRDTKLIIRHEYDQAYGTMESKKWTYRYSYHNWQEKTPYLKFDSSKSGYRRFSMLRSLSFTYSRFFCQTLYLFVYRIM